MCLRSLCYSMIFWMSPSVLAGRACLTYCLTNSSQYGSPAQTWACSSAA